MDALLSELDGLVKSKNVAQGKQVLNKLKLAMLTDPSTDPAKACSALELGVLLSVVDGDLDAFGRNMAQLQPYYLSSESSAQSPRKSHITGLNLMHLLVDNRQNEFHSQLEHLSEAEAADPLVSFPISLDRKLMVGIYDEVLAGKIPDPSYQVFMDQLLETVRENIADCIEVSYKTLELQDAAQMMKFSNVSELQDYISTFRDDWIVEGGILTFEPPSTTATAADIPSMEYITQSLTYATEIERIV